MMTAYRVLNGSRNLKVDHIFGKLRPKLGRETHQISCRKIEAKPASNNNTNSTCNLASLLLSKSNLLRATCSIAAFNSTMAISNSIKRKRKRPSRLYELCLFVTFLLGLQIWMFPVDVDLSTSTSTITATVTVEETETETNTNLEGCQRRCHPDWAHRNILLVEWNPRRGSGLQDRLTIISNLALVAGHLCAVVYFPPPYKMVSADAVCHN